MGLLDKKFTPTLSIGNHLITPTNFEEAIDKNGKEYLSMSYKADGQPEVRRKLLYETELEIMADGIAAQFSIKLDNATDLVQFISENPFRVELTEVYVAEKDRTYTNWKYNV